MIDLGLAVACSLAIAVIFKLTERRGLDRVALLAVNYLAAFAVAAGLLAVGGAGGEMRLGLEPGLLALGVGLGALFIGGFVLFSYAIAVAGLALATATMRLAVALPFLASWLVWGEVPSVGQGAGLAVAGAAFVLITRPARAVEPEGAAETVPVEDAGEKPAGAARTAGVLALLFLAGGTVDVAMKAFEETYAATNSSALFLLMVFGVAFLLGEISVVAGRVRRGRWPRRAVLGWGLVLGVVNYGSAEFILRALAALPGTFVFPVANVAIVAGAAVLGVAVWRERLSRLNALGLALAAAALVLLSL